VGISEEMRHLKDLGINGSMILKWFLKSRIGEQGLDCSGSGQGQAEGSCQCGNEPSGFIKCGEFLD
jgi:hypothetical protein